MIAYETKSDIHLHIADDRGNEPETPLLESACKRLPQGIDEFDFSGIDGGKAGIKIQDTSKDGNRHTGNDDGCLICPQPYDEKWGKCGFWKAV